MILIDANLLVYAVNRDAFHHNASRTWLEETLGGTVHVGLPWVCILAFLRVTTHPSIFAAPLRPDQALGHVESWLAQPFVEAVAPGKRHWPVLRNLLRVTGSAGNLTTDAHIAALAIEHGATIFSADHDFKRFPGVHHVNPLEPVGRGEPVH
ncbi:MAG: type II toxin-antitoxin system VapC family toxin [Bryobacterales bacterium]|nr:type II toxin-antitoxin system VapC family toxin [Bryobacterales bacterium]